MVDRTKKLPAFFYETPGGNQPVRVWMKRLPAEDRQLVGRDVQKVEFGWPIGLPYCRSLGSGLWEVRSDLTDGKIGRITQKTSTQDIELALKRMKEVE